MMTLLLSSLLLLKTSYAPSFYGLLFSFALLVWLLYTSLFIYFWPCIYYFIIYF